MGLVPHKLIYLWNEILQEVLGSFIFFVEHLDLMANLTKGN